VEGRSGSKVLERNTLQGIDAKQKKNLDCGDISGDIRDSLEKFEANPLVSSGRFLSNECTRDIHSEPRLGDSGVGAFFGQQVQILDAAVQHIYGVDNSQMTDLWYLQFNRAPSKVLGGKTDNA
jgi:hypothetical protein